MFAGEPIIHFRHFYLLKKQYLQRYRFDFQYQMISARILG